MAKYATGKRSQAISDRSGMAFPYTEMVKEWNGSFVHISEFEPKHPQIRIRHNRADAIALQNTRAQKFQQPTNISGVKADSGGITVAVANLTLPGSFAFSTQTFQTTNDGLTTSVSSMVPQDPSLQNRRRKLTSTIGNVTVSIS